MSDQTASETTGETTFELKETLAMGVVLGTSVFGMLWGFVNTLLVRYLPSAIFNEHSRSIK